MAEKKEEYKNFAERWRNAQQQTAEQQGITWREAEMSHLASLAIQLQLTVDALEKVTAEVAELKQAIEEMKK